MPITATNNLYRINSKVIHCAPAKSNKYINISKDNPIRDILDIEGKIRGKEKTKKAYQAINNIIGNIKKRISSKKNLSPETLLNIAHQEIEKYNSSNKTDVEFVTDAFNGAKRDCDTGSMIFMAIAYELKWPLSAVSLNGDVSGHMYIEWQKKDGTIIIFETTGGYVAKKESYLSKFTFNHKFTTNNFQAYMLNLGIWEIMEKENCTKAIEISNKIIKLAPKYIDAYYYRAQALKSIEKWNSAINDFTKLINSNHYAKAKCYYYRGTCYLQKKQYTPAQNDLEAAIALFKKQNNKKSLKEAYIRIASALYRQEKHSEAIAYQKKVLLIEPRNTEIYNNLAVYMLNTGEYSKALSIINKIINIKPNNLDALGLRGYALIQGGKYKEGLKDLANVLQKNPSNVSANFWTGYAYYRQGQNKTALQYIKKVLAVKPNHRNAQRLLKSLTQK